MRVSFGGWMISRKVNLLTVPFRMRTEKPSPAGLGHLPASRLFVVVLIKPNAIPALAFYLVVCVSVVVA